MSNRLKQQSTRITKATKNYNPYNSQVMTNKNPKSIGKWLKEQSVRIKSSRGLENGTKKLLLTLSKKSMKRLIETDGQRLNCVTIRGATITLLETLNAIWHNSKKDNGPCSTYEYACTCESTRQLSASTWRGPPKYRGPVWTSSAE